MAVEIQAALIGGTIAAVVPLGSGLLVFAFLWGRVKGAINAIVADVHEIKETLKTYDLGGLRARVEGHHDWLNGISARVLELERERK